MKYTFPTTNNESEYKAISTALKIAIACGIKKLIAKTDSLVLVGHINQTYEAKGVNMQQYLAKVQNLMKHFDTIQVIHISSHFNHDADMLSKIPTRQPINGRWLHPLTEKSICEPTSGTIDTPTWMTPIIKYIKAGTLLDDPREAKKVKTSSPRYTLANDQLYHHAFSWPLPKCVSEDGGKYILREIHEGIYGAHICAKSLTRKVIRVGYFSQRMQTDVTTFVF